MSTEPIGGTIEAGGFTVTSTHETPEQITEAFSDSETKETSTDGGEPDPSKAAAVLGKKGGEAAAAKRAAEAKEAAKEAKAAEKAAPAQPAEADDAGPDERTDEEKRLGKPRHDPRARMLEATRKEAEAKREAAAAREEARLAREEAARHRAELEAARATRGPERQQPKAPDADAPKESDFEDYSEYVRASVRHEIEKEMREAQRKSAEARAAQEYHQRISGYVQRFSQAMTKAATEDPTFRDRVSPEVAGLQPTITLPRDGSVMPDGRTWIADELLDNPEHAPALALHLSEHPEDFQRIAALQTPRQVTREMAKLVTKVEAAARTEAPDPAPTVSKAKPPVRPVAGAPPAVGEPDPDTASFDEHLRFYNAKDRRR